MNQSFGARLRRERERQRITLAQIAESTKIKASLFEGLERDDVSRWPAGIFRRSFIRAYAQAIGLDTEQVCREFQAHFPERSAPAPSAYGETVKHYAELTASRKSTSRPLPAELPSESVPLSAAHVAVDDALDPDLNASALRAVARQELSGHQAEARFDLADTPGISGVAEELGPSEEPEGASDLELGQPGALMVGLRESLDARLEVVGYGRTRSGQSDDAKFINSELSDAQVEDITGVPGTFGVPGLLGAEDEDGSAQPGPRLMLAADPPLAPTEAVRQPSAPIASSSPQTQQPALRWRAGALDLGVVLVVAGLAYLGFGTFWMPLGLVSLAYYVGATLLIGTTPGVALLEAATTVARPLPIPAAAALPPSLDRAPDGTDRDPIMTDGRSRTADEVELNLPATASTPARVTYPAALRKPVDIGSRRVRA